jgi:hypothetical protein
MPARSKSSKIFEIILCIIVCAISIFFISYFTEFLIDQAGGTKQYKNN